MSAWSTPVWYVTTWSGARSGAVGRGPVGPRSPPHPPSPRMNAPERVVNSGSPVAASTDSVSVTTNAPDPLSYTPATVVTDRVVPSTGIGWWNSMACSPWTSIVQLISPSASHAPGPGTPSTTPMVGSTCCGTPWVFSVTKGRSSTPQPTPSA